MKRLIQRLAIGLTTIALLAGCAGQAVQLGSRVKGPLPTGQYRAISAEACGFQLFLFIPIAINGRIAAAYAELERQAAGDFIADVEVQETWGYRLVGTQYCTQLRAKAVSAR